MEGRVVPRDTLVHCHLVGVFGDDVQLSEPVVIYACGRPDLRAILDIAMFINVCHGFSHKPSFPILSSCRQ